MSASRSTGPSLVGRPGLNPSYQLNLASSQEGGSLLHDRPVMVTCLPLILFGGDPPRSVGRRRGTARSARGRGTSRRDVEPPRVEAQSPLVTLQDSIRRVWTVIALHTAPGTPQFIKGWAALIPHGR